MNDLPSRYLGLGEVAAGAALQREKMRAIEQKERNQVAIVSMW